MRVVNRLGWGCGGNDFSRRRPVGAVLAWGGECLILIYLSIYLFPDNDSTRFALLDWPDPEARPSSCHFMPLHKGTRRANRV